MKETKEVLQERGSRYGKFEDNARITQDMYAAYQSGTSFSDCSKQHDEAVHMICHKISRMVCGDPFYEDNLVDIIGYTQLLLDFVRKTNSEREMFRKELESFGQYELTPKGE